MSKENAKRYRSQDEWDRDIVRDSIPLANKSGFDFTLADSKKIQRQSAEMNEDDLNQVAGGSAVLGSNSYYEDPSTFHSSITGSCEKVLDDSLFEFYFYQNPTDCSNYQWTGSGSDLKACCSCNYRKKQI